MKFPSYNVNQPSPFFLIAGPCVIESEEMALSSAMVLKEITEKLGIPFVYKSSFDKANRTSSSSPRGPGRERGLDILARVRQDVDVPVLTDVHTIEDIQQASKVVDVLQTPAFLCRQTDLIEAAAKSGKPVNIKKGQFLSPVEMQNVVDKAKTVDSNATIMVCERGSSFGYNNLVVDMRSLEILKATNCPVVFDATHSVQLPGAGQGKSSGQREFVPVLSKAAVAIGIDGLFMETHPQPEKAFSDGPNAWPLDQMEILLKHLIEIDQLVKQN
jgi:2-dehydro-3-deoxyphosphooctonate aldolase (KDO 8-P synthase)